MIFSSPGQLGCVIFFGSTRLGCEIFSGPSQLGCVIFSDPAQLRFLIFSGPARLGCVIFSGPAQLGCVTFSDLAQLGCVIFSGPAQLGHVIVSGPTYIQLRESSVPSRGRHGELASNHTQSAIKHCLVFTGRNKEAFCEFRPKLRACRSLYSKLIFEVLQGKVQMREPLFATPCCNTSRATSSTPSEPQMKPCFEVLWFSALVQAAVVNLFVLNLVCFVSVCLYPKRGDCRTPKYGEETKKTLPRRPGHVAPRGAFSCRCANAAILNATS